MKSFDAKSAECLVYTFKEGLLSGVAHDLKLRVERFVIEWDEAARRIEARFDAASLSVVCAMRDDREAEGALSAANRQEIDRNIRKDVLASERFSEIVFVASEVTEDHVSGSLTLHGKTRPIAFPLEKAGDGYRFQVLIHQPDFGIRPYRAMLGALRIKAGVIVAMRLKSERLKPDAAGSAAE